ncbi:MAG TPA: GNAT family N-acetyltransferase, partial [Planctomycetota bacterium]|nr:GNAT family N-acetyltransferase [Planctomycetota bacterium]
AMARETEDKSLDPAVLERGVRRALADPAKGRYLVAEQDGRAVGGLLLTLEWSDWRDGWFWWIQSVYVEPEARGAGAYRALHEHVLAEARRDPDVRGVRLYVEVENTRARAVYERLGMAELAYRVYGLELAPRR